MSSQRHRQERLLADCISSLKIWKNLIDTQLEGEEKRAELSQLKETVQEFCLIDHNTTNCMSASEEVMDYFQDDSCDHTVDIEELYNQKLSTTPFTKSFDQHKIWKEVFVEQEVSEVQELRPEAETLATDAEFEEINDSLSCLNVFTPPIDPISKMVIQEPYKNKKCGHVYEHRFILQYIKTMGQKAKCPYIGCANKYITKSDLVEDKVTKEKISQYSQS